MVAVYHYLKSIWFLGIKTAINKKREGLNQFYQFVLNHLFEHGSKNF